MIVPQKTRSKSHRAPLDLDTRVRRRQNPPGNVKELREALLEEWNNIPKAQINNLIHSMRRRSQDVRNVRDGHTKEIKMIIIENYLK